jgi:6-phosphogluconate dehydrogenase
MVHNGIEYGDMQLIAEVYDCLKGIVGMTNVDMSRQFARWNDGDLSSYLIEITAKILAKEDDVTGTGYVLDYVSQCIYLSYWLRQTALSDYIISYTYLLYFSKDS